MSNQDATIETSGTSPKEQAVLTEQQIKLQELWNKGKTATQISEIIGRTRAAVLGQVKRLRAKGFPFRSAFPTLKNDKKDDIRDSKKKVRRSLKTGFNAFDTEKSWQAAQVSESPKIVEPIHINPANKGRGILLVELRKDSCRAIIGETGPHVEWRYCGDKITAATSSYCNGHRALYYAPIPKRDRQNMQINAVRKPHNY